MDLLYIDEVNNINEKRQRASRFDDATRQPGGYRSFWLEPVTSYPTLSLTQLGSRPLGSFAVRKMRSLSQHIEADFPARAREESSMRKSCYFPLIVIQRQMPRKYKNVISFLRRDRAVAFHKYARNLIPWMRF